MVKPMTIILLSVASVLLASVPNVLAQDVDEQKIETSFVRPDPAPDPDASGSLELRSEPDSGTERFEVEVENVDASTSPELWMADGTGVLTLVATLEEDGDDLQYFADLGNGDSLPFGVTNASDLSGRSVEIRSQGAILLHALIPAFGALEVEQKGEAPLSRPVPAVDTDITGKVEIRSEPHKGRERFEIEVKHVNPLVQHDLFLEDAVGSGVMVFVASLEGDDGESDSDGELKLEVDTQDGDGLPLGALLADDLALRRVEVRADGQIVLEGVVPEFIAVKKSQKSETLLVRPDPAPDADAIGRMKMRSQPFDGRERIEIEVKGIDASLDYELFMEDDVESGVMQLVGSFDADGSDSVDFEVDTEDGDALPFGASINAELVGRRVEVQLDGSVVLQGVVSLVAAPKAKLKGEQPLVRPDPAPDADITGRIRMRSQPSHGRDRFEVSVWNADVAALHELWLEDVPGSGVLVLAGSLEAAGSMIRLRVDTKDGDGLPLGVASSEALAGRRVEIRSGAVVLLVGGVPDVVSGKGSNKALKDRLKLEAAVGSPNQKVRGDLKLSSKASKGDERFEISGRMFDFSATGYRVFLEDAAGSTVFVDVGAFEQAGKGSKGRFRRRTKDGDSLPLAVDQVTDLGGRSVEVRDDGGAVFMTAVVPLLQ